MDTMTTDFVQEIQRLPTLRRDQLVPIWKEHFPTPPPPSIRKELMVPLLSYRMQEEVHGGLSMQARRRLQILATTLPEGPRSTRQIAAPQRGTRILRQWRGETHEVWCTDEGFLYLGQKYTSLSKIATVITGTKWSGPAFFGLKK